MQVSVLLGGDLRKEAAAGPQQRTVGLADDSRVEDLITLIGLDASRIGMIIVNGRGSVPEIELRDGDRVGLFPPELRYNTFVSIYFRPKQPKAEKEKP
jgi:hypothetical protein